MADPNSSASPSADTAKEQGQVAQAPDQNEAPAGQAVLPDGPSEETPENAPESGASAVADLVARSAGGEALSIDDVRLALAESGLDPNMAEAVLDRINTGESDVGILGFVAPATSAAGAEGPSDGTDEGQGRPTTEMFGSIHGLSESGRSATDTPEGAYGDVIRPEVSGNSSGGSSGGASVSGDVTRPEATFLTEAGSTAQALNAGHPEVTTQSEDPIQVQTVYSTESGIGTGMLAGIDSGTDDAGDDRDPVPDPISNGPADTPAETVTISRFTAAAAATQATEADASGSTTIEFIITRTSGEHAGSVHYALTGLQSYDLVNGDANGVIEFEVGELSKTLSFEIAGNDFVDGFRTPTLTLSGASTNHTVETASASMQLIDDEVGTVSIEAPASSAAEGQSITIVVTRGGDISDAASFEYRVAGLGATAVDADDFLTADSLSDNNGLPSGTVVFAANEATATITIEIASDATGVSDETLAVLLDGLPEGSQVTGNPVVVTLTNDDVVYSVEQDGYQSVEEGNGANGVFTFVVTRTGNTAGASTVDYTITGFGDNAANSSDFVLTGGTISFAAGETSKTVAISTIGDSSIEGIERFSFNLVNAGDSGTIAVESAVATIIPDESVISIEATNAVVAEGSGDSDQGSHVFTVTRGGNTDSTVTVTWTLTGSGENAVDADDFGGALPSGTITFEAGETTKTIVVRPTTDQTKESHETYTVTLACDDDGVYIADGAASGTVLNDEAGLSVSAVDLEKLEGNSGTNTLTFTIDRSSGLQSTSSVTWSIVADAVDGIDASDFVGGVLPSGTVTFQAGETTKTITVELVTDAVSEGDEGFSVVLSNPSAGADIVNGSVSGTVYNDDMVFALSGDTSVAEGNNGTTTVTLTVTRTGYVGGSATVDYTVAGTGGNPLSASDFAGGVYPSGTVTFLADATTATITLQIATDAVVEAAQTFEVSLGNPSAGGSVDAVADAATVTVTNDDFVVGFSDSTPAIVSASEGADENGTVTFTLTRSGYIDEEATVNWTVGGGAVTVADFVTSDGLMPSGTATFAAGSDTATITITLSDDTNLEDDETFTITLSSPSAGGTIDDATRLGEIVNDDTGIAIAATATNVEEGDSGTSVHSFIVTRSGVVTGSTTLTWTLSGAADASDFEATSGTITFEAGETSKTIEVKVLGDDDVESNENFTITLSDDTGAIDLLTASASGTIVSDDAGLALAAVSATLDEGGQNSSRTIQFTITRTGDLSGTVTADWTVSGDVDAGDFGGTLPSGTVTLGDGVSSQIITLVLTGDDTVETDEAVTVTLSNPSDGATILTGSASTTVTNDDTALTFQDETAGADEGAAGAATEIVITVVRTGDTSGSVSADWRVVASGATNANDFVGGQDDLGDNGSLPSGTVSFAAGESTATITVTVSGDTAVELDEDFQVVLSDPGSNVSIDDGTITCTIVNDDEGFSVVGLDADKAEGADGTTTFTFVVTRSGSGTSAAEATYTVTGGTADDADFVGGLATGTVSFAAGEYQKTIIVTVQGDSAVEDDETFTVTLSDARLEDGTEQTIVVASAEGTIRNDDIEYAVSAEVPTVAEGDSGTTALTFTVTRTGDLSQASTIDYAVLSADGGTGSDLSGGILPSGTVSFAANQATATVTILVNGDDTVEGDETFTVTLSDPSVGRITTPTASTMVRNDDTSFAISADAAGTDEGNSGTTSYSFTVARSGDLGSAATVNWAVSAADGITAADFGGSWPSGTVNFAADQATAQITVDVSGDLTVENDETLTVTLSSPSEGTITTASASTIIVGDDDRFDIAASSSSVAEGHSGSREITFTVTRTGPANGEKTVAWSATGIDADDLTDGSVLTGTLTFNDGDTSKTITLSLAGDTTVESDETITVTLSDPSAGGSLGTASAATTVTNDDASVSIAAASATKEEGNLGTVPLTFTVTRTGNLNQTSTVEWRLTGTGSHAADGNDFSTTDSLHDNGGLPSGTVSFAAGSDTATITVYVAIDSRLEEDETFTVTLSEPSSGTVIDTASATGTIENDDAEVNFTGTLTRTYDEGDSGPVAYSYTITRTGNTDQVSTVYLSVSGALSSSEYSINDPNVSNSTVTFAEDETSKTVTVYVFGDNGVESDESFTLRMSSASSGTSVGESNSVTGTVDEDDVSFVLSGGTISQAEGTSEETTTYTYTITRSTGSEREATIRLRWYQYSFDSNSRNADSDDFASATVSNENADDTTLGWNQYTTLTFAEGENEKTVTIVVQGDDDPSEPDEGFRLYLIGSGEADSAESYGGYTYGRIVHDESAIQNLGMVASVGDTAIISSITEGDTAADGGSGATTTVTWAFRRLYSTVGTTTCNWYVSNTNTNTNADDWAVGDYPSGTVTFEDGEEYAYVTFEIATDDIGENGEYFYVYTSDFSAGSSVYDTGYAYAYIANDDTVFSVNDPTVNETDEGETSDLVFTVTRSGDTRGTDTVDWSITFTGTETGNDGLDDASTWYNLDFDDVSAVTVNGGESLTFTYDEESGLYTLSSSIATLTYNSSTGLYTLSGTLAFEDGVSSQTVTLSILGDSVSETWKETVNLLLSNAQNTTGGVNDDGETPAIVDGTGVGTVYDDEPDQLITYAVTAVNGQSVEEGTTSFYEGDSSSGSGTGTTATITVYRTATSEDSVDNAVTVAWKLSGLSGSDSEDPYHTDDIASISGDGVTVTGIGNYLYDYVRCGTISFDAGETEKTITVTFLGDYDVESDDSFSFEVLSARDNLTYTYINYGEAGDNSLTAGVDYGSTNVDADNNPNTDDEEDDALTLTLLNDDVRLWVRGEGSSPDFTVTEGDDGTTDVSLTLTRTGLLTTDLVLTYTITVGNTNSDDWEQLTGTVTVAAGSSTPTITIPIVLGDTVIEDDETFTLTLSTDDDNVKFSYYPASSAYPLRDSVSINGTLVNDDTVVDIGIDPAAASQVETDSGQYATYTFVVSRSANGYSGSQTVEWRLVSSDANASDFYNSDGLGDNDGLPSGTVSFSSGEFEDHITIYVYGDTSTESSEDFQIVLSNTSKGVIGTGTADATIVNDDTAIAISDGATVTEGDSGSQAVTFTVTRSGDTSVTSTMAWTLINGSTLASDFSGDLSGELTFNAGETEKTITVHVAGDNEIESNETYSVRLSDFTGVDEVLDNTGSGEILNSDSSFAIAATSADTSESSGTQTFTITRTSDTAQTQTINWTIVAVSDGLNADDFVESAFPSGSVTFETGETTKTITISIADDATKEGDESYQVVISGGDGTTGDTITTDTAEATIRNDDAALAVQQVVVGKAEGSSDNTTYSFTVVRSGDTSGTATVNWAVSGSGDNAATIDDFGGEWPTGTISFVDSQSTATISITVAADSVLEEDEGFTVTLSDATNATITTPSAEGTIANDDAQVTIAAEDAVKGEGDSGTTGYTFTVTRTGSTAEAVTLNWEVTSAEAEGSDFVTGSLPTGTVTFAAGASTATITVEVAGDQSAESDEDFTVTLINPPDGIAITTASAEGTIEADDVVFDVSGPASVVEGDSGTTYIEFTVTRTGNLSESQTLTWTVAGTGADAADADDFGATTGIVAFEADDTSATIRVPISGDTDGEPDEGFALTLTGPDGVIFTNDSAEATIVADEASLRIEATDAVKLEGAEGTTTALTFRVVRSGVTTTSVSADWTLNHVDTDAADFQGTTSGTLEFAGGVTEQFITITVAGDIALEDAEEFTIDLSNPSVGTDIVTAQATGEILSDDTNWRIELVSASSQNESDGGGSATYTLRITREGGLNAATIAWAVSGSGDDAADVDDFGGSLPTGNVFFAQGEDSQEITITVSGDDLLEADEGFLVTLSDPTGVGTHTIAVASVEATIANDDALFAISQDTVTVDEGDDATTTAEFSVTRTGSLAGTSTVCWRIVNGSTVDGDFVLTSGTLTFGDGIGSQTLSVNIAGDGTGEGDETYTIELYDPSSGSTIDSAAATASGVIANDDVSLTLSAGTVSVDEGDSEGRTLTFVITRTGDLSGETSVDWAVASGTADATDFATLDSLGSNGGLPSGTVVFSAGESVKTITILTSGDGDLENDETFTVTLSNASDSAQIEVASQSGTIVDDDDTLSISATSADRMENADGGTTTAYLFTVTRSGSATGSATVTWTATGVTLSDDEFATNTGTLTFAEGETSKVITVLVNDDDEGEMDETFAVTLSEPSLGSTITTATATGTVRNDDPALYIAANSVTTVEGDSGETWVTFTVTREGSTDVAVSATWTVSGYGDNAADGLDFGGSFPSGVVNIAAGETTATITFFIEADSSGEGNEGFQVTLSDPVNATIVDDTATSIIGNDDTVVSIAATDADKSEGDTGDTTTLTFTVTRDGAVDSAQSYDWQLVADGDNPVDLGRFGGTAPSGTVTFAESETAKTISITIDGNDAIGEDETFSVYLADDGVTDFTDQSAAGVIRNDDSEIAIDTALVSVAEGDDGTAYAVFTVYRTGDLTGSVAVDWAVQGDSETGSNLSDFGGSLPSGTVTFADGQDTATINVAISGDTDAENTEDFKVVLSNPGAGASIMPGGGTGFGRIVADDTAVNIYGAGGGTREGDSGTASYVFTITRAGDISGAATLSYAIAGANITASDFVTALNGAIVFAAGEAVTTLTVEVAGDTTLEETETFTVTLSGSTDIVQGSATGTIINDDVGLAVTADAATVSEGDSGTTAVTFTVTRSGDSAGITAANWSISGLGDDSVTGADFADGELPSGSVTFNSGETTATITVMLAGDTVVEADKSLRLTLGSDDNTTVVTNTADVVISDDDATTDGDDVIVYGNGDDTIAGGGGNDTVTTGTGNDVIEFSSPDDGMDTITDFEVGTDRIVFDSDAFGNLGYDGAPLSEVTQTALGDTAATIAAAASLENADIYRIEFTAGTFANGTGDDGDLDELEAAFTDDGGHTGAAFFIVSDGEGSTWIYYDADTASGDDGSGLVAVAELENVDSATDIVANVDLASDDAA